MTGTEMHDWCRPCRKRPGRSALVSATSAGWSIFPDCIHSIRKTRLKLGDPVPRRFTCPTAYGNQLFFVPRDCPRRSHLLRSACARFRNRWMRLGTVVRNAASGSVTRATASSSLSATSVSWLGAHYFWLPGYLWINTVGALVVKCHCNSIDINSIASRVPNRCLIPFHARACRSSDAPPLK